MLVMRLIDVYKRQVYAGTNPSSAADWALVGLYKIGRPLGRRCLSKIAGDLLIITQNGVFPMSAAIQSETIDYKLAISFKIENAFNEASNAYGSNFGWKAQLFPTQSALLVNIPITEDGMHEQYVMNTITKAWCKFTSWYAEDLAEFNNELYYVEGTKVVKAWTGENDNGSNITASAKCAFNYLGDNVQMCIRDRARAKTEAEVNNFANDGNHPYFDELADEIAIQIKAGKGLQDAYDTALFANPVTRAKEIARISSENAAKLKEKKRLEAEKAIKATSSNVRTIDTTRTPTEKKGALFSNDYDTEMLNIAKRGLSASK